MLRAFLIVLASGRKHSRAMAMFKRSTEQISPRSSTLATLTIQRSDVFKRVGRIASTGFAFASA